ncbi:TldD/PmbA family protein [Mycoplasmatota bacterium]|nr:TldD/PmbA family protein [Mycoplasmatota bacterium]
MFDNEILKYTINEMKDKVDKCQCSVSQSRKYELNLDNGEISLLRTTINNTYHVIVINDNKKGSISINKTDKKTVDEALTSVIEICENSEKDEAFDIASVQDKKAFIIGDNEPDLDKMYDLLAQYVKDIKSIYPTIKLMDTAISFTLTTRFIMNSNDVDFKETKGIYDFSSVFAAKEGTKSSSFNYSGYYLRKLENNLLSYGSLKQVLDETIGQIETKGIEGKFNGDVIFTPDCLSSIISNYVNTYLTDISLMSGTSLLKDKLNEQVASPKLTLHAAPRSEKIANGYHITNDGFEAKNMTIIDKGILKSYALSQYGANKTGLERSNNMGGCYILEPGEQDLKDMIKSIEKGVLVNRVSGGHPNENGDLSVVLKNSYYIEDGEIKYPLNETMIALNLKEAFNNIIEISKENVDFGSHIFPYVKIKDVLVSGK